MKNIVILLATALVWSYALATNHGSKEVTVYKSPYCGCCTNWVSYLRENGYSVAENKVNDVSLYKEKYGVSKQLSSCHTATVGGYVIEGHVPVSDIERLLKEKPDIRGLTVPGMPIGSPGMEQGERRDPFNVYAIKKDGSIYKYSRHNQK